MPDEETVTEAIQVGIVELLVDRIYPLDPDSRDPYRAEAMVLSGTYPVFRDAAGRYFWRMAGTVSRYVTTRDLGHGAFTLEVGDRAVGPEVVLRSQYFTRQDLAEFVESDPLCVEGPARRLRFSLRRADR